MQFNLSKIDSPLGTMLAVTDAKDALRALEFEDHEAHMHRGLRAHYGDYRLQDAQAPPLIANALRAYFDGQLDALKQITTATGGDELQRKVWAALRAIPSGTTTSYGEMARALGFNDPRMAVEIGAANGANPIAIVVPCHRVIAKNGDLKGYAWGVHRKRWLLEHENAMPVVRATPAARAPAVEEEARLPGF